MSELECFGCLNNQKQLGSPQGLSESHTGEGAGESKLEESLPTLGSHHEVKNDIQTDSAIYFKCECCGNIFCNRCCEDHIKTWSLQNPQQAEEPQNIEQPESVSSSEAFLQTKVSQNIKVICQECEEESSAKYCEFCGQYLCEKCSFKIHNKGKRAKHTLDDNVARNLLIKQIMVVSRNLAVHLKEFSEEGKNLLFNFQAYMSIQHKSTSTNSIFMLQDSSLKELEDYDEQKWIFDSFQSSNLKYEDLTSLKNRYPFATLCKILVLTKEVQYQKIIEEEYKLHIGHSFVVEVCEEWKKIKPQSKHDRVLSERVDLKHNKNISNFSNLSAISKVEVQSVISNEPSDLFQSNQLSLTVTQNNNESILMMGNSSDVDRDEKRQLRDVIDKDKQSKNGHHRIYSIRQQNSHNSGNNISSSTENSLRKRNKRWPIPYFQPFRIPKYERGSKYDGELFLRELAEKGILMMRRQKAEQSIMDPDISRHFVRNIGEKQIQYVAYIIDFLSVECLTWVIESIKEDKMTPNQKLIQSRLKESFDLKVNMKLWDSILKYLQSPQYQQDYFDNTPNRYIPKISVVKYGEEYLLEFQQRKWAYEDQQLLDQEEQEWQQFKKLITDYFHDHNQITGGRYGCVQYVKLNGPKPLRKCSLGKLSLYVQEAINKGIIRYHKTLLVSNSENNNTSFCSQLGSFDDAARWGQTQKELKIMAIQLALIDMFLEAPQGAQISLAQIPLNLKKTIIFQYTLVELGFPKLKNILNTLSDKLILQTTKTHISYELTTNGAESIDRMRRQAMELNQNFLSYILGDINTLIIHYQSMALEDLYSQLTLRLGFPFEHKLYQFPDFYQFLLYYCANFATVQYVGGTLVVYSKYYSPPAYEYQTHRTTYSHPSNTYQQLYSSCGQQYSKTALKAQSPHTKYNKNGANRMSSMDGQDLGMHGTNTPTFNSNEFIGEKVGSMKWCDYLEHAEENKEEKEEEECQDENQSREMEHIINILDDGDVSAKGTVIVNQETEQQQNFYLLPKLDQTPDELQSFGGQGGVWGEENNGFKGKGQHNRIRSSNQVAIKHNRQYSTAANIKKMS